MNLEVGSTIGDYQIIDILGAGGMGKVYKVRNIISDRVEAMKVLLPNLAEQPELADRFLREIKVQASLEHPNIAGLHTAVRVDNQLLMLMEYLEGVTLEQKLRDGPLPISDALDFTRQALSALEYAHARGVVHRDIKPANMMLTPGGVVKVMDFGIAKSAGGDRRLTVSGTTIGSLYYMSPEQIQGAQNVDARSDLYSVGVSLYEMLTGRHPFDGDSQYAIMAAHLEKTPVPPIQIDPRLPPELNDLILMSVGKDPNARFQSAAAFRNALGNVAVPAQTPASAPAQPAAPPPVPAQAVPTATLPQGLPPSPPLAAPPPASRSRRGLWMAVGAVAAVLAVVAVVEMAPWKSTRAAPEQQAAPPSMPTPPAAGEAKAPAVMPAETVAPAAGQPAPPAVPAQSQPSPQQHAATPPPKPAHAEKQPQLASPAAVPAPPPAATQPIPAAQPAAPPVQPEQRAVAPAGDDAALEKAREDCMMLGVRASGIRSTLQSMERQQAAMGHGMNARLKGPWDLMENYLHAADNTLNQGNLALAKTYLQKAQQQIEILEKALNR